MQLELGQYTGRVDELNRKSAPERSMAMMGEQAANLSKDSVSTSGQSISSATPATTCRKKASSSWQRSAKCSASSDLSSCAMVGRRVCGVMSHCFKTE